MISEIDYGAIGPRYIVEATEYVYFGQSADAYEDTDNNANDGML